MPAQRLRSYAVKYSCYIHDKRCTSMVRSTSYRHTRPLLGQKREETSDHLSIISHFFVCVVFVLRSSLRLSRDSLLMLQFFFYHEDRCQPRHPSPFLSNPPTQTKHSSTSIHTPKLVSSSSSSALNYKAPPEVIAQHNQYNQFNTNHGWMERILQHGCCYYY